jgi:hypothetical protein
MDFYPWVVIAHVFFVIIAFAAHGTSAFAMFQARREADRPRLAAVLDLSQASLGIAGVALILGLVLGIVAAIMGGHFGRLWPWAAIGVVVVVFGVMTPVGANPMSDLRKSLGLPRSRRQAGPIVTRPREQRRRGGRAGAPPSGPPVDHRNRGDRDPRLADGGQAVLSMPG